MSAFTPEQEARLRAIIREEIAAAQRPVDAICREASLNAIRVSQNRVIRRG